MSTVGADPSRRKRSFVAVVLAVVALIGVVGFWQSPSATGSFVAAVSSLAPAASSAPTAPEARGHVEMQAVDVMSQRDLEMAKIAAEWDRLVEESHKSHHEHAAGPAGPATARPERKDAHRVAVDEAARPAHKAAQTAAPSSFFGKYLWRPILKFFAPISVTAQTTGKKTSTKRSKAEYLLAHRLKAALPATGRARAEATDLLKQMIAARQLTFDERKRMYRSWRNQLHPDRHIADREVATQVFMFLGASKEWFLPEKSSTTARLESQ
jgi:hypothetical protein